MRGRALTQLRSGARELWVCSSVGESAPLIRVRSEVRLFPDPPLSHVGNCASALRRFIGAAVHGAVAQLGEHLLCKQGVTGSIPVSSTIYRSSLRQAESKRSRILVAARVRVTGVLLRLFFSFFNNLE